MAAWGKKTGERPRGSKATIKLILFATLGCLALLTAAALGWKSQNSWATSRPPSIRKRFSATIEDISILSSAIAAAVEEQAAATQEISSNIQQAAHGTAQVAGNIEDVSQGAAKTSTASSQVLASAQVLSDEGGKLKTEVSRFFATVRAA
jgi:hypothetical protein